MEYAKSLGAKVISVTCAKDSEIDRLADIGIAPKLGGEVVTGSTQAKERYCSEDDIKHALNRNHD